MNKQVPQAPPPPTFRELRCYPKLNKEEVHQAAPPLPPPPPPTFRGIKHYPKKNSDKIDEEKVHQAASPPPPPLRSPLFREIKRYSKKSNDNIDKEVVYEAAPTPPLPPPPTFRGIKHYPKKSSDKMDEEKVHQAVPTPPPPPPPTFRGIKHYPKKSSDKMDEEKVHHAAHTPPPAPAFLGFRRYHNQNNKNIDKEEVPPAHPPPPPPPLLPLLPPPMPPTSPPFGPIRKYDIQKKKEMDTGEVPRVPHLDNLVSQTIDFMQYQKENRGEMPRCCLSHPTYPHHLTEIRGTRTICFLCGQKRPPTKEDGKYHFICNTCNVEFHRGCHMFPRKTTHPYHLQHPLTLTELNYEPGMMSNNNLGESSASIALSQSCTSEANTSDPDKSGSVKINQLQSDKCTWCGKHIEANWFYRCSICNFCLDLSCFQKLPLLLITNPKSHHHSLVFYPRPLLTPCDACGLVNVLEPSYACFQCNYMVHLSCIDLPRVIKITRHQHRLLHTPFLQSKISPCRVCYKTIDTKYGQYSCNDEECSYVAHSKCATHEAVWDKKELEWEPEEPDESEDIAPFKKVGTDMIKHFSHEHLLKLEKFDDGRDAEKQCQACILPINSRDFYKCMECDYFLHEVCAGLLRKLNHALHIHPLWLDPSPQETYEKNACLVCSRKSTGFRYKCSINCDSLEINLCCILVPDYFNHKAHEHPLFISITEVEQKIICKGCNEVCQRFYLQCTICKFAICYGCCTIPDEIYYKYDKHPLALCYGEGEKEGMYWCEVCEKEIDPTSWFYTCNECCVTIHRQCLFGSSSYMKPGFTLTYQLNKLTVLPNNSNTRPLCLVCGQRCPSSVYYTLGLYKPQVLCSLNCISHSKKIDRFLDHMNWHRNRQQDTPFRKYVFWSERRDHEIYSV